MEELSDEEYESQRSRLFEQTRLDLFKIAKTDPACIDARLVDILLANVPLDDCINDLMRLELEARGTLEESGRGFLSTAPMFWSDAALDAAQSDPLLSAVGNSLLLAANAATGFLSALVPARARLAALQAGPPQKRPPRAQGLCLPLRRRRVLLTKPHGPRTVPAGTPAR